MKHEKCTSLHSDTVPQEPTLRQLHGFILLLYVKVHFLKQELLESLRYTKCFVKGIL